MIQKLLTIFTVIYVGSGLQAQVLPAEDEPAPEATYLIQTGISFELFNDINKTFLISVEKQVAPYFYGGIQCNAYLPRVASNPTYYDPDLSGGFEFGIHAKHLLHGRLSGRKSGLYLGLDFRKGIRRYLRYNQIFFPASILIEGESVHVNTFKILFRAGIQWQFRHAVLELSCPFGQEFATYKETTQNATYTENYFSLLPGLQIGFAF